MYTETCKCNHYCAGYSYLGHNRLHALLLQQVLGAGTRSCTFAARVLDPDCTRYVYTHIHTCIYTYVYIYICEYIGEDSWNVRVALALDRRGSPTPVLRSQQARNQPSSKARSSQPWLSPSFHRLPPLLIATVGLHEFG